MGDVKHSPGPWYAIPGQQRAGDGSHGPFVQCSAGGDGSDDYIVAEIHEGATSEADAALVAAGPTMLAELEETAAWLDQRAEILDDAISCNNKIERERVRLEATRLRGRAVVIRQTILKAKG